MSGTISLDPAASYGPASSYKSMLDPQSDGGPGTGATRFQDILAGAMQAQDGGDAVKPPVSSTLGDAWDWTKQQAGAASQAVGSFDAPHGHVLTRAAGAAQAVGAVAEGLTGAAMAGVGGAATATGVGAAPGVPAMIGGGALVANALDNGVAGVRTAWTGEFHHTLASQAAGTGARVLGASDQTAERITAGVDLAQGVAAGGTSVVAGIARKGAVDGVEAAAKQSLTKGIPDTAGLHPTADELTKALPGHGNARHGTQTTIMQQTTRVQTGLAPDGKIAPTTMATRFDSSEAQLDAVNRALSRTNARDANGLIPHEIAVAPNGSARLPRDQSVVTGYSGGYGSGVQLQKPVAPGRPVTATGQLPNALVVLERQPATGQWHPVTQYPTNKPVTP